ncbi:MAG TPA: hypothetical protein VNF51_01795 [Candidatus Paceibacterota bacterium]|nr:hypothetical protein [Candidatus Paceibacterota bacterium]
MIDVRFDEEQESRRPDSLPQESTLVRLVLTTGVVKTRKGAEYFLFAVVVVCAFASFFLVSFFGTSNPPVQLFKEGQNVLLPPGTTMP